MAIPMNKSRLETNFIRLLEETENIANGSKPKDWTFEKKNCDRNLTVLYASQTGTAQDVAEKIGRECRRFHLTATVAPFDAMPIESFIQHRLVVCIVATTGQGQDPDNMHEFFTNLWTLRKNHSLLLSMKFAILGLGDSSYEKFNFSAKRLSKLLTHLGAETIVSLGLADDQHDLGPDFVVDVWIKELWKAMLNIYPLPEGVEPISAYVLPPPKYKVIWLSDLKKEKEKYAYDRTTDATMANPCLAEVTVNKRVTAVDHFQDVRIMEFNVSGIRRKHKPGDVLMVQPQNLQEYVQDFMDVLGLKPEEEFYLESTDSNVQLPSLYLLQRPCSVRECVESYWDIQAVPKRYFFELLSFFTSSEMEKEKFLEFSQAEGLQELYNYCHRPHRTITEVLADFSGLKDNIPFEYLFDLVPAIKPRAYSIASSALAISNRAQILVAVVNYRTILKRPRLGLCTNWISRLKLGDTVPVWIKPGTLTFPDYSDQAISPVIMIGPGTGCAPFRAYIQEAICIEQPVHLVLYFGCRNRLKDYFFKDEWEQLNAQGQLVLRVAFSRDQDDKEYVQHKMREDSSFLWQLIDESKATVYFAGNAKRVPIDVREALLFVVQNGLRCDLKDAEFYMKTKLEKRYQTETWA